MKEYLGVEISDENSSSKMIYLLGFGIIIALIIGIYYLRRIKLKNKGIQF
jgi:hypothetical protein